MSQTFEEKLAEKEKEAKYLSLSELGDTIKAKIAKEPQFKTDKRGNEALYIELTTVTGTVVQKFGKSLYGTLLTRVKEAGGKDALMTIEHVWKQEKAGRATFNRYFPIPNTETKKK